MLDTKHAVVKSHVGENGRVMMVVAMMLVTPALRRSTNKGHRMKRNHAD